MVSMHIEDVSGLYAPCLVTMLLKWTGVWRLCGMSNKNIIIMRISGVTSNYDSQWSCDSLRFIKIGSLTFVSNCFFLLVSRSGISFKYNKYPVAILLL